MLIVWIVVFAFLTFFLLGWRAFTRISVTLEPALTPGEITAARDPEFFALQTQTFAEHGYTPAGDFQWPEGLELITMRVFRKNDGAAYGWAVEEAMTGTKRAPCNTSVISLFEDGTMLDTTTRAPGQLVEPSWFLKESVQADTELLLRRHEARLADLAGKGLHPLQVAAGEVVETLRAQERRLGLFQVEGGRMRLQGEKLRYRPSYAAVLVLRAMVRVISGPVRGKRS